MLKPPKPIPAWFWDYALWRDQNKVHPRPKTIPKVIPLWAFERYAKHAKSRFKSVPAQLPPVVVSDPPPPPPVTVERLRIMFTAENPQMALDTPTGWVVGLSADLAFRDNVVATIPRLRQRGYRLVAWGDCSKTPAEAVVKLMVDHNLDGWVGQAETPNEYDASIQAGATVIVGNADSLTTDQLQHAINKVNAGELLWLQEDYWGDGHPQPSIVTAKGIAAHAFVIGLYSRTRPRTAEDYFLDMPSLRDTCSIYLREGF